MSSETVLLATLIHSRAAFEAVEEHVDTDELSAHGAIIYNTIADYYDTDQEATLVVPEVLLQSLTRKHEKHASIFATLIREMIPALASTNVVKEVLEVKRRAKGDELASALAGHAGPAEIGPLLDEYSALSDATDLMSTKGTVKLLDKSLSELVRDSGSTENLIKLLPRRLNEALRGGALPGHTVVIIGRVNVGKSALAINNIAGFLRQGKKVLLVENEDLPDDVARRIGCRLAACSLDWAEANPEQYEARAMSRGFENLCIPDPVPTTCAEVDRVAAVLKVDVIVVNQLRHLAPGAAAASDSVGAIDRVAQQLRAIGKRTRRLMVLVGAAKEGSEDWSGKVREKAVLQMSDAYGSKTGVPGCADIMIGIGTTDMLKERGMVAVTLCKNKRGADEPVLYEKVNLENCIFKEA